MPVTSWDLAPEAFTFGREDRFAFLPDPSHRAGAWSFTAWAFCPNGHMLAMSDTKGTIGLYQTQNGTLSRRIQVAESNLWALAYSFDSRLLAATSWDGFVHLCDAESDRQLWRSPGAQIGFMRAVAFSPDGSLIAAASDDADVYVWDVPTGKLIRTFENILMAGFGLAFTRDAKRLAVGGAGSEISLLNVQTGTSERTFGREQNVVAELKLSPKGDIFAARYRNREDMTKPAPLILWDAASGDARAKLQIPHMHFNAMAFAKTGFAATSWLDGAMHIWAVQRW
jgi:WD40 repeat protein